MAALTYTGIGGSESQHPHGMKSVDTLRSELAAGKAPSGLYGDSVDGKSFTDEESAVLESQGGSWYPDWNGGTKYTVIATGAALRRQQQLESEAAASA
jgi:hypothetical protein